MFHLLEAARVDTSELYDQKVIFGNISIMRFRWFQNTTPHGCYCSAIMSVHARLLRLYQKTYSKCINNVGSIAFHFRGVILSNPLYTLKRQTLSSRRRHN